MSLSKSWSVRRYLFQPISLVLTDGGSPGFGWRTARGLGLSVVLDSYAWIEYLLGSVVGETVEKALKNGETFKPSIVLAEIAGKYLGEGVEENRVLKLRKPALVDRIILPTGTKLTPRIIIGDEHFKGLNNVMYLG